ncbi:predicted protein [Naegleria gruberi]|uniref:Ubiquitin thioesterase OTU n=1 Tax=Naegleria gruberi TaxID=5762 RepID=D2VPA5_NAEGR|nr:uncharacterized protein NAEGRDRAFT_80730 [Naegleria gruberi]EFC41398.1 predicted protein [Naegleria gruberi]|eukprot:XP_002674142.1 predicted protein [Naegleria gruberi strain NEG-M]
MIRIRLPASQMALRGVDFSSTVDWLKQQIQKESKIEPSKQKLKMGFPPQEIAGQQNQSEFNAKKLSDIGVKSGESLIVEETSEYASIVNNSQPIVVEDDDITPSSYKIIKPESYSDVPPRPHSVGTDDSTLIAESVVIKRVIDSDNSCLFNAFAYCLEGCESRKKKRAPALRRVIRDWILNDPIQFNEAILGQSPKAYCEWIMKDNSWGGSLEIMILSQFYNIRVDSFDVTSNRRDVYGEGDPLIKGKILLLYDGIHYDALAINPVPQGPEELDITILPADDDISSTKALELVKQLHNQHQFTDTATFTLKCLQCGEFIKGEKEATLHAKKTGHSKFGERK